MDKNLDELTRRVWEELGKIYSGDRARMREAIDRMCDYQSGFTPSFWETQVKLVKASYADWTPENFKKTVRICQDLKANWDKFTTEPAPPPSPSPLKAESYNQLVLDFSATTELSPLGANSQPRHDAPPYQEDEVMRSLTLFPNESIFLAISRRGTRKGWLTPQYKIKYQAGGNSTTTNPHKARQKTYGPYWVFCWPRQDGNNGHYYLGKFEGKKFQHFCEIWKSSHSLEEVLRRINAR